MLIYVVINDKARTNHITGENWTFTLRVQGYLEKKKCNDAIRYEKKKKKKKNGSFKTGMLLNFTFILFLSHE